MKLSLAEIETMDRAALIALQPKQRERYAGVLREMLRPGGWMLLVHLFYDQSEMSGPPHSVPAAEVEAHYAGWSNTLVSDEDVLAKEPKFASRGLSMLRNAVRVLEKPQ